RLRRSHGSLRARSGAVPCVPVQPRSRRSNEPGTQGGTPRTIAHTAQDEGRMSSIARLVIDDQNPWPGLGAFDEAAQQFFNGRGNETAELRRLVLNASLTVLFGASGLGKTS